MDHLAVEIERLREYLNTMLSLSKMDSEEVLKLSGELDRLITQYLKRNGGY